MGQYLERSGGTHRLRGSNTVVLVTPDMILPRTEGLSTSLAPGCPSGMQGSLKCDRPGHLMISPELGSTVEKKA